MKSQDERFRPSGMGWWVDPRICSVRVADLHAYLLSRGWEHKPQSRRELILFEQKGRKANSGVLSFPSSEEAPDYVQRVTEAITALAEQEERYAVEVLNDILQSAKANVPSVGNGLGTSQEAKASRR